MSTQKPAKAKKSHKSANTSQSSSVAEGSSSKKQQVYDTVNVGLDVIANVSEGSDILAPLKAACKTTKSILDVMQAIDSNQEDWKDLTQRLGEYKTALEEQTALIGKYPIADKDVYEALNQPLARYMELLKGMQTMVVNLQEKRKQSKLGVFKAFSKVKVDAGEIRRFNRDIEDRHRQLMSALTLFIALLNSQADSTAILQLPTVDFVASSVHSRCLEGTREAVLKMIWDWANGDASDKPIFWLCDIAGSGKSTVAMSALETWQREGTLGGRFFFSMASNEASTTDKFCPTIARNLAHYIPQLGPHIADAIKRNPSFMQSSLGEQFQTLVTTPILRRQQRVILVIDAVDECKSGTQRKQLLDALCVAVQECKDLKIFMTSRPDPVIQSTLETVSIKAKVENRLHDVNHPDNVDDIAAYIHRSLDGILSPDKRQQLVEKAQGLFIWASTACRMLNSEATWDTPENVYDRLISVDKAGDIDDVYGLIFERIDPKAQESMCKMLALLLAAFEPLTVDEVQDILTHVKDAANPISPPHAC
ncbi:hypothetical protein PIIN_10440 [Serendipita indica DSM 11827]|uniref:Nephrocystin 3-like N-terminal domain-containing protein n=1 Tax=Serendipita indica (strain DSM 11827) TaxID=1109443 RepID=G4TYQ4_SERID|nr:hypothetical protein PIIN_10440 [Serendipita indica DSM 11827]